MLIPAVPNDVGAKRQWYLKGVKVLTTLAIPERLCNQKAYPFRFWDFCAEVSLISETNTGAPSAGR